MTQEQAISETQYLLARSVYLGLYESGRITALELKLFLETAAKQYGSTGSDVLRICEDRRSSILPDGPVFDDAAVLFLIKEIKITSSGTAMFHLLDGNRLRYPLSAATPKGMPGMAGKRRNHQRIMELHSSGMGATEIARALGISVNTVRSYLRRLP